MWECNCNVEEGSCKPLCESVSKFANSMWGNSFYCLYFHFIYLSATWETKENRWLCLLLKKPFFWKMSEKTDKSKQVLQNSFLNNIAKANTAEGWFPWWMHSFREVYFITHSSPVTLPVARIEESLIAVSAQHLNQIALIWALQGHWGVSRAVVLRTHDTAFKVKAILDTWGKKKLNCLGKCIFSLTAQGALVQRWVWASSEHWGSTRMATGSEALPSCSGKTVTQNQRNALDNQSWFLVKVTLWSL